MAAETVNVSALAGSASRNENNTTVNRIDGKPVLFKDIARFLVFLRRLFTTETRRRKTEKFLLNRSLQRN